MSRLSRDVAGSSCRVEPQTSDKSPGRYVEALRRGLLRLRRARWHWSRGGVAGLREHLGRERRRGHDVTAGIVDGPGEAVSFDEWPIPRRASARPDLRVAVILDQFSMVALEPEWTQLPVPRQGWRRWIQQERVDMLFVESAWAGNGGAWAHQLMGQGGVKDDVKDLLTWCRANGVPSVFWNKEDPVHHNDFLEAAALFDHVFTTDSSTVDSYRSRLGHDRVHVLPFAAQPAVHNPVRTGGSAERRDVAFAGMYFAHTHRERRQQMEMLLGAAVDVSDRMPHGLEIFSRLLGGDDRYQFPAEMARRVVGSLNYRQMLTAYRSYKVFLNVNTVVSSPSMCARRVFEITACGTPVVSASSLALDRTFPRDEVVQVETRAEAADTLRALVASPELRDRLVHRAQRRIWSQHTYGHRVDTVLANVGLESHAVSRDVPHVTALVSSKRPEQLDHVLATLAAQEGVRLQLALLAHGWDTDTQGLEAQARDLGLDDVVIVSADSDVPLGECLNRLVRVADGALVAKMDDDDLYGPHYLADQVNALHYSGADIVGKQAHYVHLLASGATGLRFAHREHRFTDFVSGPTIVTRADVVRAQPFAAVTAGEDTAFLRDAGAAGCTTYSADRFNFVQMRGGRSHTWGPTDSQLLASSIVQTFGPPLPHVLV